MKVQEEETAVAQLEADVSSSTHAPLGTVDEAIAAIARGEAVVVLDDADRENEGDLIVAAELATPDLLAFMVQHTSGLICVGMAGELLDDLAIPMMVGGGDRQGTAFTVSVDLADGVTTGISAADRAATIRALADPTARPRDFVRPGHVFPLRARPGGVLERGGHTEAAVDLVRAAGLAPAGVLCEIVRTDGTMARWPDLHRFAAEHGLVMITIDQLVAHRWRTEQLVRRRGSATIPTLHGRFTAVAYESLVDGNEHIALVLGDVATGGPALVRLHSECLTGDVFGSTRCDCGDQLDRSLAAVSEAGRGVVAYLRGHEGRGIGLAAKIEAYALQERGFDTVDANLALGFHADHRHYGVGAQILADLGLDAVRLMTNNPDKAASLDAYGIEVTELVSVLTERSADNAAYLDAKRRKLGHLLPS